MTFRRPKHTRRRPLDPMAVGLTAAVLLGGMAGTGATMHTGDRPAVERALLPPSTAETPGRGVGAVGKPPPPTTAPTVVPIRLSPPTTTTSGDAISTSVPVRPDVPPTVPSTVPPSTTVAPAPPSTTAPSTTAPAPSTSIPPPPTSTTKPGRRHGHGPAPATSSEVGP